MNRLDFYFEQIVTQADLDEAFDGAEQADRNLQSDNDYVGVTQGFDVAQTFPTPALTVDIAPGVAYDPDGRRVFLAAAQTLAVSVDSNAVPTTVANPGNEKWLAVFVAFDRVLSEPRVDGNGVPLQYRRSEGYQFIVDQGPESTAGLPAVYTATQAATYGLANGQTLLVSVDNTAPQTVTFLSADFGDIANAGAAEVAAVLTAQLTGAVGSNNGGFVELTSLMTGVSASIKVVGGNAAQAFAFPTNAAVGSGGPTRPALRPDAVLLADVLLRNGTTQVFDAPGNGGASDGVLDLVTRRQWVFVATGTQYVIREGTITGFADALSGVLNAHINDTGASHPATAINYDPSGVPPAWQNLAVSGDLQSAIDAIYTDLGETTLADEGAVLVGHNGGSGVDVSGPTTVSTALLSLDAGKGSKQNPNVWLDTNTYQAITTFQAQTNHTVAAAQTLRATGLLALAGAGFEHVPRNYAGTKWGFNDGGVLDAKVQHLGASLQHTLTGALSESEIILFNGSPNPPAAIFGMVEGHVLAWNDTGTASSMWDFRAAFYLPSGVAQTVTHGRVIGSAAEVGGGVSDLSIDPIMVNSAGLGQLRLQLIWLANLGAKRNIAVYWRVSYYNRAQ